MRAVVMFVALWAAGPVVPEDPRLAVVRAHLQEVVDRTAAAGLPAEMIVGKVREGLAKGVAPARIDAAAQRLADSLDEAGRLVGNRGEAGRPLVRAVAEARMAGVPANDLGALVRAERPEAATRRAVEVLSDLALRGYPTVRAVSVVRAVLVRDGGALDKVPGTLETIRHDFALTHAEAADALARGLAATESLQGAASRTAEDERRRGNGRARDRSSDDHDSPGHSGSAPGHLPKVNPSTGALPPGQGKKK